ncbi:MAG TPA: family 1 encapsulin nanocompartment shell protein [Acidimicrobiales bacterium]|nr:family 1 encapsulin nanocompartment shell protein [Acidimicrobiales bacterium]
MSGHLRRRHAPITDEAWRAVDEEATRSLRHFVAGRPLVDFAGSHGWEYSAAALGRTDTVTMRGPAGVEAGTRRVQPVLELRTPFTLQRAELDAVDRGAADPDLSAVTDAARRAAAAEDGVVFYGLPDARTTGVADGSPHTPIALSDDYDEYPGSVAKAVAVLREAGVGGPFGIALGPRCYTGVIESTEHGGYPVLEHIRFILGGPIVWAPAVDGAVVVSLRGGDYVFDSGQDFSVGYVNHTNETVDLYIEESFTFRVVEPRAAVALRYP